MKTTLKKLFYSKKCLGWAYRCKNNKKRFIWQNTNDLGLLGDINDMDYEEIITRKIKIKKAGYIAILKNTYGLTDDDGGADEKTLIACIKDCHNIPLNQKEKQLSNMYYGIIRG